MDQFQTMNASVGFCRAGALFSAMHYVVQSAVLRSHVVRLSVCDIGGSESQRLEILETNCMDN